MNEVIEILKEYLSEEKNTVHYYGEDTLVTQFEKVLYYGKTEEHDAPDSYIRFNHEIWIIEHFEFDAFKSTKKGSLYKKELSRIKKVIEQCKEGCSFKEVINVENSYNHYMNNVTNSFNKHYKKIDNYNGIL